jgi:hypothetical protein
MRSSAPPSSMRLGSVPASSRSSWASASARSRGHSSRRASLCDRDAADGRRQGRTRARAKSSDAGLTWPDCRGEAVPPCREGVEYSSSGAVGRSGGSGGLTPTRLSPSPQLRPAMLICGPVSSAVRVGALIHHRQGEDAMQNPAAASSPRTLTGSDPTPWPRWPIPLGPGSRKGRRGPLWRSFRRAGWNLPVSSH